jgi:hypothetical protein
MWGATVTLSYVSSSFWQLDTHQTCQSTSTANSRYHICSPIELDILSWWTPLQMERKLSSETHSNQLFDTLAIQPDISISMGGRNRAPGYQCAKVRG